MAQTAFAEAEISEPETSGHQHPRTEISQILDRGEEIFWNVIRQTSAAVTTAPDHPMARTSEIIFLMSVFLMVFGNCVSYWTVAHSRTLTRAVGARGAVLTWLLTFTRAVARAVAMVVAIIFLSLAMFTFISHEFILILSRGFMLILSRVSRGFMLILSCGSSDGIILILNHGSSNIVILTRGVSSSPAEISSAPEAESSAPRNAATASSVQANAAPVNAATASVPVNAATASVPEAESSAQANADESSQGAFAAAIAAVNAVADRKQLVPIIISVLGTFMSIVAATLMLDKDVSHSIRDLGLAVFYLQVLAMICLLVGMGIKQLLGMGIKQQLRQLLFVTGIVMASVSVLFMVVFISLVFIVASKKK